MLYISFTFRDKNTILISKKMVYWDQLHSMFCELLKRRCETFLVSQLFTDLQDEEKVCFVYELLKNEDFLPEFVNEPRKNSHLAIEFRKLGNQSFYRKRNIEALKFYTRSITLSPVDSEELALAYANRSAVLFRENKYSSCVSDITRALENNYPESLKQKLLNRKEECCVKLEAIASGKCIISEYATDNQSRQKLELPKIIIENKLISNASDKIKIRLSDEMGRYLEATDNITPGEILAVEKPYASVLLPQCYLSHCSNCFVRTEASVPCKNCSQVVFCGSKCYEDAIKNFHELECKILPYLSTMEFGKMELLALRILLVATRQGTFINTLLKDPRFKHPFSVERASFLNTLYSSDDYCIVHNLENNLGHQTVSNLFKRTVASVFIIHGLKCVSFFPDVAKNFSKSHDKLSPMESYVGTLILKYLLIVSSNAHEVSEFLEWENESHEVTSTESLEIGAALYPLLSLINHACDPNVVRHSYYNNVVLRSIQPITKGEQIFDNYGYHFAVHARLQRQTQLKNQYCFDCSCDPCKLNWATLPELTDSDLFCNIKIESKIENLGTRLCEKFSVFTPRLATEQDLNSLLEYLSFLHENVVRPSRNYCVCQEVIKQILAYKANYHRLYKS